jgi:hypothetical protein
VQRHELELEAAGEIADHQQDERAVCQRFRQRLFPGLARHHVRARDAGLRQRILPRGRDHKRQRDHQEDDAGEDLQRRPPADLVHEADAERRKQELAE